MPRTPVVLVAALLLGGCGGNIGNPTDAALMQTAREIRDGLKLPPEDRPIETLNLTRAIQIAAQDQPVDATRTGDPSGVGAPIEPKDPHETERLAAVDLAQDARLALLAGDEAKARPMLEESLAILPTVDALAAIAPLLVAEDDHAALDAHCEATWNAAFDSDERRKTLEVCIAYGDGDTIDEIIPWASPEVRATVAEPLMPVPAPPDDDVE